MFFALRHWDWATAHILPNSRNVEKSRTYKYLAYVNNFTLFISHCALALIFSLNLVVVETLLREVM